MKKLPGKVNVFRIEGRVIVTDGLAAKLAVLPESSCLWPFISENGGQIVELDRLRPAVKSVLQIGTAYRCGAFRAQRDLIAAFIGEGVHLLFHDVRSRSYAAREKGGVLKRRRINPLITIELADTGCFLLDVTPVGLFLWQNVGCSAWCPIQFHSPDVL